MGVTNLFNTGKSGLFANRASLATTGHNIANVNTEGFTRQRVEHSANAPAAGGNVVYGTGVRVSQIHRINDEYLTRQIGNEMKTFGAAEEKDIALAQAESVFNEIGNSGLNRLLAKFFNEFRKLGNEPESHALRTTVKEASDQLSGDFRRIAKSIRDVQKNIDVRIEANVRQVNEIVKNIAHLNAEIKRLEVHGGNASDLQDKRDMSVKRLSTILDVNTATNEKGEFTLSINGVGPLISGTLSNKLKVETAKSDSNIGRPEGSFVLHLENLVPPEITSKIKVGRLGGLIEARDELLGGAMKNINELAYTFASKVNEIHRQGYSLNGSTGIDFFKLPDQIENAAEKFSISEAIRNDEGNIATALIPDSPGDNRLVQMIANLQGQRFMAGGRATLDDHYNGTVAELATYAQKNKQVLEHQTHILGQLEKFRESISGVSLDEETTNLVQFQHAFDASAKVIKVADEMLETVLRIRG